MDKTNPTAEFPKVLKPLFEPYRYKVFYGGRGGSKSWGIARALLILGSQKPLRILCARELQKSIKDSVHKLLSDQVNLLGLQDFYQVQQSTIKGRNGTEFFFEGLRHNSLQIKSYEGIDICWVEEAVSTSKSSWDYLIPTIRKDNSEIWISFNPELEEDETYQRFVVNPPTNSIVVKVSWKDNPWFTDVLKQEMFDLQERDYVDYETVWEGKCRPAVEGAIYADEMRELSESGRITRVPYDPKKPVNVFWDLGYGDNTSMWFIQQQGFEYHAIDFYQNSRKKMPHYIEILQNRGYVYGTLYLPHDGKHNYLVGVSPQETLEDLGYKVEIVPRVNRKVDALNATRSVLPFCVFDKDKTAEGLQSLRRYRYEINLETGKESRDPLHDIWSHGADAFATFGTAPNVQWDVHVESQGYGETGKMKSEYDPYDTERM